MRRGLWLVISAVFLGVIQVNLFADDTTGWKSPTTYARCIDEWSNPGGACDGVNGEYAEGGRVGDEVQTEGWGGFNFNIPANASITGIQVRAYYRLSSNTELPVWNTLLLSWNTGCEYVSHLFIYAMDTTWQWDTTDWSLWGHNWTPDELTNGNFTCAITAHPETPRKLWVDSLQVNVSYTTPTPTPTSTPVNQICNPSFETPTPTCWNKEVTKYDAESMIDLNNTERARSGSKSCKYDNPTANYFARDIRSDYIPVTPGDEWQATCYYYLNQDTPGSAAGDTHVRFRMEWWDTNGDPLTPNWYPAGDDGIDCANFGNWNAITYNNVTVPTGSATMTLRAFCREVVTNDNDFWLDDFSAVKQ